MTRQEAYNYYNQLIARLKKELPYGLYNDLKISDYFKNKRMSSKRWLYNRHHIYEIDVSGSGIMNGPYANTEAIIVDTDIHSLLHYLIILSERTRPNWGMLLQFDSINEWDMMIRKGCNKYNIPYDKNWQHHIRR